MTTLSTLDHAVPQEIAGGERLVRNFLFLATFLLTWFTVSPFPDLGDPQAACAAAPAATCSAKSPALLMTGALARFRPRQAIAAGGAHRDAAAGRSTLAAFAISAALSSYPDVAGAPAGARHLH